MLNVLSQSLQWAAWSYEQHCKEQNRSPGFIVNLRQRPEHVGELRMLIPTLMTKSSILWSQVHQRLLVGEEHLFAKGFPFSAFDFRKVGGPALWDHRDDFEQLVEAG